MPDHSITSSAEANSVCLASESRDLDNATRWDVKVGRNPTPTKVRTGHDENITVAQMCRILGSEVTGELERRSRAIYAHGAAAAAERGIIIADTKFEFGRDADGRILLIDEVLTPDSSRFWPVESYAPGRQQPSFDKQPLRHYLDSERRAGRWNGEAPPPRLPPEIVDATSKRYLDAFRRLTGTPLDLDALA